MQLIKGDTTENQISVETPQKDTTSSASNPSFQTNVYVGESHSNKKTSENNNHELAMIQIWSDKFVIKYDISQLWSLTVVGLIFVQIKYGNFLQVIKTGDFFEIIISSVTIGVSTLIITSLLPIFLVCRALFSKKK